MLSDVDLDVAGLIYTELTVCSLQLPLFTSIHPACKKLGVGFLVVTFEWSFARLTAPTSVILSSNKSS